MIEVGVRRPGMLYIVRHAYLIPIYASGECPVPCVLDLHLTTLCNRSLETPEETMGHVQKTSIPPLHIRSSFFSVSPHDTTRRKIEPKLRNAIHHDKRNRTNECLGHDPSSRNGDRGQVHTGTKETNASLPSTSLLLSSLPREQSVAKHRVHPSHSKPFVMAIVQYLHSFE